MDNQLRRFIDAFFDTLDPAAAAEAAGLEAPLDQVLRREDVRREIAARRGGSKEFLREVMRDGSLPLKDRMHAAEYLDKCGERDDRLTVEVVYL